MLEVVAGILRNEAGDILLAQRLPHKQHGGLWEFPGGKIEPGESRADAIRRELKEELGIDVECSVPFFLWSGATRIKRFPSVCMRWKLRNTPVRRAVNKVSAALGSESPPHAAMPCRPRIIRLRPRCASAGIASSRQNPISTIKLVFCGG